MKIKPLFDRVVLKPETSQTKTQSGLILPETNGEKPMVATVVYCGPGGTGENDKMFVSAGDKVIYSKFGGVDLKLDGENYIIIRQTDILAILEDK